MTTISAISDGSGGYKPSYWPDGYLGADYNGTSYCFITPEDMTSPDARVLASPSQRIVQMVQTPILIPSDFFGMHFHRIYNNTTAWPTDLRPARVRGHDAGIRWQEIQPSNPGSYDWGRVDTWLSKVESMGAIPVFTVFGTPAWASSRPAEVSAYGINGLAAEPTNMSDLANFVTAVANRYGTRIPFYEVWNEPNLTGFYTGTRAKLCDMVKTVSQAVKAVTPTVKVICPAITSFTENAGSSGEVYLTAMLTQQDTAATGTMLNWVDVIGVHLYRNAMVFPIYRMVQRIKNVVSAAGYGALEIWDTESGILSPFPTSFSDEVHLQILQRKIVSVACSGIKAHFWYSYDNGDMGFKGKQKIIDAYMRVSDFLAGKTIISAVQIMDGTTEVIREDGAMLVV